MTNKDVPYIVHEGSVARLERTNKRLMVVAIIAIVLMFLSNALWLWAWSQYDYSSYELSQDGEGVNIVNGDGNNEVYNGPKTESPSKDTQKAER